MQDWQRALHRWAQDLAPGHEIKISDPYMDALTVRMPVEIDGKKATLSAPYPRGRFMADVINDLTVQFTHLVRGSATLEDEEAWSAVAGVDDVHESGGGFVGPPQGQQCIGACAGSACSLAP